jgi:hypothetical protein
MNLDKLGNGLAFDKESGAIGIIASVNLLDKTIVISDLLEGEVTAKLEDAIFLERVGAIGEEVIYNRDIVTTADGKTYEIVAVGESDAQLHLINDKLERVEAGDVIKRTDLHVLAPYVEVIGNFYELEPISLVDFNIQIVRDMAGKEFQGYKYACNRPEVEEVDLVNLLFAGHPQLEEQYARTTITHEQYAELVDNGSLKEVTLDEVLNYLTGMDGLTPTEEPVVEPEPEPEENAYTAVDEEAPEDCDYIDCRLARVEKGEVELCEDCGELVEDCDCDEW